jgi:hypothetical protein
MSDLAPFVAAVLRDKVVVDLMLENGSLRREIDSLRQQLSDSRAVTITATTRPSRGESILQRLSGALMRRRSSGGDDDTSDGSSSSSSTVVVYQRAQLEDDGRVFDGNLDLYFVAFPRPNQPQQPPAPSDLKNLQIRLGFGHWLTGARIRGRFTATEYGSRGSGVWVCRLNDSSSSSAFRAVAVRIGPFTSEAEFREFDPSNPRGDTNRNGEALRVHIGGVWLRSSAASSVLDDFEQRRLQALPRCRYSAIAP